MDKVTQSNASNAEETAAAAEELNAQASMLQEAVANLERLAGSQGRAPAMLDQPVTPRKAGPVAREDSVLRRAAAPHRTKESGSATVARNGAAVPGFAVEASTSRLG